VNLLVDIPAHIHYYEDDEPPEPCLVVAVDVEREVALVALANGSLVIRALSLVVLDYRYVDGGWMPLEDLEQGPDGTWRVPEVQGPPPEEAEGA